LAAGDVDGDSIPDLVVANAGGSSVSILIAHTGGTFEPQVEHPLGREPRAVALGDVDEDGALDIVTANSASGDASVLLGNGDGTFRLQQPALVGGVPVSIALGDAGGDGRADLFVANDADNTVTMLMGFGNGEFGARAAFGTGSNPRAVNLIDVDGDGALDLLLTNQSAHQAAVIRNRRDRTPIAIESFAAEMFEPARVRLSWRLSSPARAALDGVRVERATAATGPWEIRAQLDPAATSLEDEASNTSVWYRLVLVNRDGALTASAPLEVAPAALGPSLRVTVAGRDEVRLVFTLTRGPATIEILDVRGRLLRRFTPAAAVPGSHLLTWDRTDAAGRRAARGIYFVRLRAAGVRVVRRLNLF
jgi:hypothetical protein